jgi:hypothetical protein
MKIDVIIIKKNKTSNEYRITAIYNQNKKRFKTDMLSETKLSKKQIIKKLYEN